MNKFCFLRYGRIVICLLLLCIVLFGNLICKDVTDTVSHGNPTELTKNSDQGAVNSSRILKCETISFRNFISREKPTSEDLVNMMFGFIVLFRMIQILVVSLQLSPIGTSAEGTKNSTLSICLFLAEIVLFMAEVFFVFYLQVVFGKKLSETLSEDFTVGIRLFLLIGIVCLYGLIAICFSLDLIHSGQTQTILKPSAECAQNGCDYNPASQVLTIPTYLRIPSPRYVSYSSA